MLTLVPDNISPYSLLYFALRTAGFFSGDRGTWSLVYTIVHLILMTMFCILAVLEVILGSDNIKKLLLALSTVAISIQVYIKLVIMLANEDKIKDLLNRLEKYRTELLNDDKYRSQVLEADYICKKYSKFISAIFISFPFMSFISNFISDYLTNFQEPHLIHQVWIPWNMNEFWRYTAGTFLVFIMTSSSIIIYASCAVFQFIFTFQISPYLKILQNRLEIKGAADKTIYQNHKIVIQFLQDYNEIFSGQLLVEIMLASLYPCGFGYTLIKGLKNNDPPPLDTYLALILCFFGPFSMYYCGQEISTQMERLHESSYMSKWYEEKPKVRRDLYTMMLVTIRPLTLNYRLFITFDLKCGTTIVQGIYSYLMMINNFETAD